MLLDVIYSICFNICLLVVLAFMMTKMDFVQRLLLNEEGGSEEGRGESVLITVSRNKPEYKRIILAFCHRLRRGLSFLRNSCGLRRRPG